MKWPLVMRSTFERLQTEVWSAKQEAAELRRVLGETQVELAKHRQLLAGRSETMKVFREVARTVG